MDILSSYGYPDVDEISAVTRMFEAGDLYSLQIWYNQGNQGWKSTILHHILNQTYYPYPRMYKPKFIGIHPAPLNLGVIQWLYSIGVNFEIQRLAEEAARRGRLDIIEWLESVEALNYQMIAAAAFHHSQIEILEWLESIGIPLNYAQLRMVPSTSFAIRSGLNMNEWIASRK